MPDEQIKTVIAIADSSEAPPVLAAAQVIGTLLDMQKITCDRIDEATTKQLPRDSVILLTETQLINHLGFLRLQGFGGAVIVIIFTHRSFDDLKKEFRILKYGGSDSHNVWGYPWQVVELLDKVIKIKYLQDGNLEALQNHLKEILNNLDAQFTEVLLPTLQRLVQAKDLDFKLQLDKLENTFNAMLANNSDARHHQIQIRDDNPQNISFHFQSLIQDIKTKQSCEPEQAEDLRFVFTQWRDRAYRTVEGLAGFKSD
ncbi:hypothetical protein [Pseudanabaena sp. UWO310]|uniref:hypothetical protein n=1 Tax=Pseudanabaena sp. UWO310 TaxID=2480795 RepID=UPI00115A4579|nr:hypothetical protein [Pseudanabaena sp. UWO310]TYQ30496.1 hypothetical protein PseudUWO310_08220 [Pseudanabaena sp. UWO310]